MDKGIVKLIDEIDKVPVPIQKLDLIIEETLTQNQLTLKNNMKRKVIYSLSAAIIAVSLFTGSAFVSPTMAKVISYLPFIEIDHHNVTEMKKHPGQVKAYLNLVSAYNRGDIDKYFETFSKNVSPQDINKFKEEFNTGITQKHQFSSNLDLIFANKDTSILLSNEKHSFNSQVSYELYSYVILIKENGVWKVLKVFPFKEIGRDNYGSQNDFDKTDFVKKEIQKNYNIEL